MRAKKYIILLLLIFLNNAFSQTYNLTVSNGYGSGSYNEGDSVHVWSKAIFGDSVFIAWQGSAVQYLELDDEWHTTLSVPEGIGADSLFLQAKYDVIPSGFIIDSTDYKLYGMDNETETRVNKKVYYAFPPQVKGIVFLLHGTNGYARYFFEKYERFSIVKDLLYNGYAAIAIDANETTVGDQNGDNKLRWYTFNATVANADNNIDIKNIMSLRDSIIKNFSLSRDIAVYSLGMSNGAVFSDICASALGFNASAHVTAVGRSGTYIRNDIAPVIWIMSENDQNDNADNDAAYTNYTRMSSRQKAEWHWLRRSPVYPLRFVRSLNNITPARSDSVYQRLKNDGYLRENNFLTYSDTDSIPFSFLEGLRFTRNQVIDIYLQLRLVNAEHVLSSDYTKNIIRFFDENLSSTDEQNPTGSIPEKYMLNAWPNPFDKSTTIAINNTINTQYSLVLYNSLGQVVRRFDNVAGSRFLMNRQGLTNGMYFLQLFLNGQGLDTTRLIIK